MECPVLNWWNLLDRRPCPEERPALRLPLPPTEPPPGWEPKPKEPEPPRVIIIEL